MKTLPKIGSVIFCLFSFTLVLHAQVPQMINYQGRVVVGTTNFNGSGQFKFALVDTAGTTTYWSNDGTSAAGSEPTAAVTLTVANGLYSVLLGDNSLTNMTSLPGSVFTNSDVRLRVWFNDGTNGSQLLTPDQRIATAGYAFMADNIKDGAITSTKLATGAVGSANIANGAVGSTQLGSGLTLAGTTTGTFSGSLSGNASTATSASSATTATTAGSATNFTGSLAGDVTGTQSATSVALVGGVTAANVAAGANLANNATSANTASQIVKRDASGLFNTAAINIPTTTSSSNGVIEMNGTPILSAKGTSNFFLASGAGNFTLTNNENTGAGANALHALTSGLANSAFGAFALNHNTQGLYNTGLGDSALFANTLGSQNTAVGYSALLNNAGGGSNTAVGWQALETNTSGSNNTAVGLSALFQATGSTNIGIGLNAGQSVTTGSNNIDIGNDGAAESNTIRIGTTQTDTFLTGVIHGNGSGLTGINASAVTGTITGSQIANGAVSNAQLASGLTLAGTTTGTFSGSLAGNASTATSAASFTGNLVGDVTGTQGATSVALVNGVTAANVAAGANLANAATNANTASAIVKRDTFGNFTTGTISMTGSTSVAHNIFLPSTTDTNTGVIKMNNQTILSAFGTENLFLGTNAGNFTLTGSDNTAVGYQTLLSNTTGSQNTAVGAWSLEPNQAGGSNTAVGYFSLVSNNFGNGNTAVGSAALQNNSNGSNNIGLGGNAGTNITSGSNNIDIGNAGVAGESNTIRIGTAGTQTDTYLTGIIHGSSLLSSGSMGVGTTASPTHGMLEIGSVGGSYSYSGSAPGFSSANTSGSLTNFAPGTYSNAAIYANGGVVTTTFFAAISDERVKNIIGRSDAARDLDTLLGIEITDYRYKDVIAHGDAPFKKVIAQQVEKVFPQAVNKQTGEVPDIYKLATIKDGWIMLSTDLKKGERVRLITDEAQGVYEVLEVQGGAFRTDFKSATGKVFVYGREVKDFRNVDYDAIAMLNVSATQAMQNEIEAQEKQLAVLRNENATLRAESAANAKRLATFESRLTRMEMSIPAPRQVANTVADNQKAER